MADNNLVTQKQEVFDYVHAFLGGGMVDVELDPIHYETGLTKALTRYRMRSDHSVEESYISLRLQEDENNYTLPHEIMEVNKIYRRSVGSRSGGGDGGTMFDPFNLAYTNNAGNIVEGTGVKSFNKNNYKKIEKLIGEKEFKKIENELVEIMEGNVIPEGSFNNVEFDIPYKKDIILGSGAGKYRLYNETIPSFLKKYGKKWNAKVYDDEIETNLQLWSKEKGNHRSKIPVTIIQLTDEMKQSVQQDGQALFNIFGIGSGAAIGSNAILDSDRNNTISNITEN